MLGKTEIYQNKVLGDIRKCSKMFRFYKYKMLGSVRKSVFIEEGQPGTRFV